MTREALQHPSTVDLALYSGGDCGRIQKWRIGRHVSACVTCRSEVDAFHRAELALCKEAAELPAGLRWDRLAEEMTANIHLGVEAGECVGPAKPTPVRLDWSIAAVMVTMSAVLMGAWFLNPMPRAEHEAVLRAPKVEIRTTSAGLEVNENGSAMVLLHGRSREQQPALIVSSPGTLRARYVDTDTGQITINNVYSE